MKKFFSALAMIAITVFSLSGCSGKSTETDSTGKGKATDQNQDDSHLQEMRGAYRKRFFDHCCQSLSCVKACPLHLPLAELQAAANRQAVWKKK